MKMKAIFTSITLLLFGALGSQSYGGNPDVKKPEIKITTPTEKQQESANIQKQRIPDGDYTGLRQMGFMCIHCWTSAATCFTVIDGWGDKASDWAGPDLVMKRINLCDDMSRKLPASNTTDLVGFGQLVLGGLFSNDLAVAMTRAATRPQALALLLASPVMMRR